MLINMDILNNTITSQIGISFFYLNLQVSKVNDITNMESKFNKLLLMKLVTSYLKMSASIYYLNM